MAFAQRSLRDDLTFTDDVVSIGHTAVETARTAAAQMLDGRDPVTAFVGGNNLTTIGTVMALRDRALRVPDDVALIGFDDFEWADAFEPRLTAMVQPCREIGQAAAALLRQRIGSPNAPPVTLRPRPTLIIREILRLPPAPLTLQSGFFRPSSATCEAER